MMSGQDVTRRVDDKAGAAATERRSRCAFAILHGNADLDDRRSRMVSQLGERLAQSVKLCLGARLGVLPCKSVFIGDVVLGRRPGGEQKQETQSKNDRELHGLPPA